MNFNAIKFQIHWRLRELFEKLNLLINSKVILVYTMGKVGSTSIYYSLKKIFKWKVIFIHRMIKENIEEYNKVFIDSNLKPHRSKIGELFLKKIDSKNVKIITLIREPIGRNISDFFQDLPVYLKNYTMVDYYNDQDIIDQFMSNYPHDIPLNWFDNEFFATTKIDVFNSHFDTEKKFCHLKKEDVEVLLIRVDLEDEEKEKLINDFLQLKEFKIERHNVASAKYYSFKYKSFLKNCTFNKEYITKMLDSKYCKHFYSEKEINSLKLRFENKGL